MKGGWGRSRSRHHARISFLRDENIYGCLKHIHLPFGKENCALCVCKFLHFTSLLHTRCVCHAACLNVVAKITISISAAPQPPAAAWSARAPSLCTLDEITIRFYSIFTIQFVLTTAPCRRRRLTAATFSSGSFPTFFFIQFSHRCVCVCVWV